VGEISDVTGVIDNELARSRGYWESILMIPLCGVK